MSTSLNDVTEMIITDHFASLVSLCIQTTFVPHPAVVSSSLQWIHFSLQTAETVTLGALSDEMINEDQIKVWIVSLLRHHKDVSSTNLKTIFQCTRKNNIEFALSPKVTPVAFTCLEENCDLLVNDVECITALLVALSSYNNSALAGCFSLLVKIAETSDVLKSWSITPSIMT